MATSRIHDAISALVALCQAQTGTGQPLDEVTVFDGPPGETSAQDMLIIGWEPSGAGVTGDQDFAHLGAQSRDENFTIACTAHTWATAAEFAAERARAFAVMAAVENTLRPDATGLRLNDTVLWAHLAGGIDLVQHRAEQGLVVDLSFHVACRARI
jgi:hypothetical protein